MRQAGENWNRAYVEAPEIFDAFCRAEDPDGRISRRLMAHAGLAGSVTLEIGCGTGRYTSEWAPHAERYVAVERSPAMLALARRRVDGASIRPRFVCGNASTLPFPDQTFDRVIAGWVVVNMWRTMQRKALSEASRVLRPGRGCGVWLIENHWTGEFQNLRGRRAETEKARIEWLVDEWNFVPVEIVESELRFSSADEALRILGWLCGEAVRSSLERRPAARLTHNVIILGRVSHPH